MKTAIKTAFFLHVLYYRAIEDCSNCPDLSWGGQETFVEKVRGGKKKLSKSK